MLWKNKVMAAAISMTNQSKELKTNLGISLLLISIPAAFLSIFAFTSLNPVTPVSAQSSQSTNVSLNIAAVIGLSLTNCNAEQSGTLTLSSTPSSTGTFTSNCQNLAVTTNAPGYALSVRANSDDNTNDLIYQNPLPPNLSTPPTIPATNTGAITSPAIIPVNHWGFALENQSNFDTTYTANNANNNYAAMPSTDTTVYSIDELPGQTDHFRFFYGVNIDSNTLAGTYQTNITYSAVSNDIPAIILPPPTPPAGSNPSNISSSNPAVLDVYPTTGWEGDVVAITSNALFTNVENVTIGGTACTAWGVISESLVTCELPAKNAGTTNDIVVTNNGTNVTPANTYTHMKITYFNPASTTVSINGTTYNFYPNGFTSANCNTMTPSNAVIGTEPATSLAYVRDTRNNQTYKVKKMVDNKCWMVDNLKYIDTTSPTNIDSTTGMTFNGGDHLNNGGITAYDTVNESNTQSTTNSDKAFYNNPMSHSYCYGTTDMPTNSLTRCGYQYNWYAATNGTGTYAQSTNGTNVTGDICPANFRLPSGMSDGTTATGNGTSYDAADFTVLNASMNAGTLVTGSTSNYYTNWQPSGAWGGSFSGGWDNTLVNMGSYGYFWSSTVTSATGARSLYFLDSNVRPGNVSSYRYGGFAVRCVLP